MKLARLSPLCIVLALALSACTERAKEQLPELVDSGTIDPEDAGVPEDASEALDAGEAKRVLFIGNSYTTVNDLPSVVRALGAATPNAAVEVEVVAQDGARLSAHWSNGTARERIAQGGLDAVVLQGQSIEPLLSDNGFEHHAVLFSRALEEARIPAIWFATWARRAGDPIYQEPGRGDPAYMTRMLELRYQMAAEPNGLVARVGAAWQIALAELPDIVLYADDGSHPTGAGTLLTACVMLQAITGETPRVPDPPPFGLSADRASALCAIATRVRCAEDNGFCDGACTDTIWNPGHCGACGVACGASDPCREGVCGCDPGFTGCDRNCVDLTSDPYNCGACGERCSTGALCEESACACPSASVQKSGSLGAHDHCATLACFNSGFGPPTGHSPQIASVMCVEGDLRTTSYAELASFVPACDGVDERSGVNCGTAVSRYCASLGAVSGFARTATSGSDVDVTCVANATIVRTERTKLASFATRCQPDLIDCSVAAWSFCESLGHLGGFGPIEVADTNVDVVCFDP